MNIADLKTPHSALCKTAPQTTIKPMQPSFTTERYPPAENTKITLWFIFHGDHLLLKKISNESFAIPREQDLDTLYHFVYQKYYLGLYGSTPCFIGRIDDKTITHLPEKIALHPIRQAYQLFHQDETLCYVMTRAKQMLHWDSTTQFCGQCGSKIEMCATERAKKCAACHILFFPQIAPVMLVLISRKDEILLARSTHFAPGVYSILAGFVEPGETLEQTVAREVKEEVDLAIKALQYFGSQPWPFASNLMLGFMAEYDHGTICIDPKEIEDAKWFSKNTLPPLPAPFSLSRRMIDHWINNQ